MQLLLLTHPFNLSIKILYFNLEVKHFWFHNGKLCVSLVKLLLLGGELFAISLKLLGGFFSAPFVKLEDTLFLPEFLHLFLCLSQRGCHFLEWLFELAQVILNHLVFVAWSINFAQRHLNLKQFLKFGSKLCILIFNLSHLIVVTLKDVVKLCILLKEVEALLGHLELFLVLLSDMINPSLITCSLFWHVLIHMLNLLFLVIDDATLFNGDGL